MRVLDGRKKTGAIVNLVREEKKRQERRERNS